MVRGPERWREAPPHTDAREQGHVLRSFRLAPQLPPGSTPAPGLCRQGRREHRGSSYQLLGPSSGPGLSPPTLRGTLEGTSTPRGPLPGLQGRDSSSGPCSAAYRALHSKSLSHSIQGDTTPKSFSPPGPPHREEGSFCT